MFPEAFYTAFLFSIDIPLVNNKKW